jgi:hypothetical protein
LAWIPFAAVAGWAAYKALTNGGGQFDDAAGDDSADSGGPVTVTIQQLAQAIARAEGFGVPGAIPTVAHNPGDLVIPGWEGDTLGSAGISVLPDDNTGWARLYHQLQLIVDGRSHVYSLDDSISDMASKWTTTEQEAWANNVAAALGVSPDVTLREILGA